MFGLVLMPMRVVSNTTLLLEGSAEGTLQVLVGKLLPAVLMAVVTARCWPNFASDGSGGLGREEPRARGRGDLAARF